MALYRDGIKDPRAPKTLASASLLPTAGRYDGDTYLLLDVDKLITWDLPTTSWVEPISVRPVQNAGNPNGVVTGYLGRYCRDTIGLQNYICVDYPSGTHWDVI